MDSPRTLAALDRADALRADLDAMRPLDADRLGAAMQRLRIEWTYHSNAIEGNSLDYGETRALLMHGVTAAGKPLKDHLDIQGHREALDFLEAVVQDREPLTLVAVREMHKLLLGEPYLSWAETPDGQRVRRTITPGEFKTQPNHVVTVTGETHYYARPEEVPARMQDLMDTVRDGWAGVESGAVHPVVFASDVHHRFAEIHPFDDGNGRTARLLMNLVLMRSGFPPAVIRQENRPAYYGALAAADGGDLAPLVRFTADELTATLELYLRALRGEPDPDVFSRRLGLLKREVETQSEGKRSPEVLSQIASQFVIPLLRRLDVGLEEMKSVFNGLEYSNKYTFTSNMSQVMSPFPLGDLVAVEWAYFDWTRTLKGHAQDPTLDIQISVRGSVGADHVAITVSQPVKTVRIPYALIPSREEAVQLADEILLRTLDLVEDISRKDQLGES